MPRYFFNVKDGRSTLDRDGTELADIYQAQAQAIELSGQLLRDMGAKFWDSPEWKLEVSDESGRVLFVLCFLAEERPVVEL